MTGPAYEAPSITDYGTLAQITADSGLLLPTVFAQSGGLSVALSPSGATGATGAPGADSAPGGEADDGGVLGESGSGGADGDTVGDQGSGAGPGGTEGELAPVGGSSGTSGGDAGNTDEELPFTGAPLAPVAAAGSALAGTGLALRRLLNRF